MRKIRSYVKRDGRLTSTERNALIEYWPITGLSVEAGMINLTTLFQRQAPCWLEIGFGSGQSLFTMAQQHPEYDFIGIETYLPGISAILLKIQQQSLPNIRLYHADAVDVLTRCIPNECLDGVQIFFPDPWPKRRHHKRRLIQTSFINLLSSRLKIGAAIHLATDWQDYAIQMMNVLTTTPILTNLGGFNQFAKRSIHRPIMTKFEQRGIRDHRTIWELQFRKESKEQPNESS